MPEPPRHGHYDGLVFPLNLSINHDEKVLHDFDTTEVWLMHTDHVVKLLSNHGKMVISIIAFELKIVQPATVLVPPTEFRWNPHFCDEARAMHFVVLGADFIPHIFEHCELHPVEPLT